MGVHQPGRSPDTQNQGKSVAELRQAIEIFRRKNPAREEGYSEADQVRLELKTPIMAKAPEFGWGPTELGKSAVNIIITAVSAQLAPRAKK